MKYVNAGNGKIPLITLVAILSISLIVNLPGLAISPLLGKLKDVFPHVSELESQLLVVLPNFVIIPFILWSGKICNINNQTKVLVAGLLIYIVSGILFLFADNMVELIVLSCLLGVGCGLCIPLAASLIAQNFVGKSRTKQLGMKSGLSNFTVIFATLFVGWIASKGWHLAFLVYLIPLIPLCLVPFMSRDFIIKHRIMDHPDAPEPKPESKATDIAADIIPENQPEPKGAVSHVQGRKAIFMLLGVIGLYIAITYATMVISDYIPYTMKHYKLSTTDVGVATAMYFAAATCSGFTLTHLIETFKRMTPYVGLALCIAGLYMCGIFHTYVVYMVSIFLIGFGYGILQPIIYDKTAYIASTPQKSTQYFAYTLTGNYIAIAMVPFIVDMFAKMFHQSTLNFPYYLNATILLAVMVWGFFKCKSFVFDMVGAVDKNDKPQ